MTVLAMSDAAIVAEHMNHVHTNKVETLDGISIETATGGVLVECCIECAYSRVTCAHDVCDWNEAGTELICAKCGTDVA